MAFVQKSDKHPKGSNPTDNDSAITLLNEMYDAEDMEKQKTSCLPIIWKYAALVANLST